MILSLSELVSKVRKSCAFLQPLHHLEACVKLAECLSQIDRIFHLRIIHSVSALLCLILFVTERSSHSVWTLAAYIFSDFLLPLKSSLLILMRFSFYLGSFDFGRCRLSGIIYLSLILKLLLLRIIIIIVSSAKSSRILSITIFTDCLYHSINYNNIRSHY